MGRATSLYKNRKGLRTHKAIYQRKIGRGKWVTLFNPHKLTSLPPPLFYLKEMVEVAQHTLEMPPTQGGNHFADGPKLNGGNPPEMTPNP